MIKHIVMWDLKDKSSALEVKAKLEALKASIPQIIDIEVGIDLNGSEAAADVMLYSTFASLADLETYQNHPDHQAVIPFMQSVTTARKVVDYEI